ncbi:hypothetical protein [Vibrio lentus]|uniref:Uncharacterized protein n=1 Tax=Vibrio lentus TaxID=136468 RepID=A0A2N7BKB4_9VIBR|nr:hypothetical protein [Vibrio lentus]PME54309.1 hypothetical protein BCV34_05005 [Vibrio lentus]PME57899.1 hypothetical protein BCV30_16970 [Vibrio lentus]PME94752.1 hypothetical protein BCV27_20135 [Vibrio lentus]PMG80640.1 hypothetical protein BCU86_01500 [Vibrio lentus]PMH92300.1 hypothetical protein BCU56_00975 [Vibrio lentus]
MAGRKEILTEQLAHKIARMIDRFPDAGIPVTWDNVIMHVAKRFGHKFKRNSLSQKAWDGKKIIAESFREAKGIQKRMQNESLPKYKTATRAVLHQRIELLEAKCMQLQEELELVRAQQIDELDAFLNTPRDIHKLIEGLSASSPPDELPRKQKLKGSEKK